MNYKITHFCIQVIALALLYLSISGVSNSQTAYAIPSLPIVTDHRGYSIEVYPQQHRLIVQKQGQKLKSYNVAVGNPSTPTPVGEYQVVSKGEIGDRLLVHDG